MKGMRFIRCLWERLRGNSVSRKAQIGKNVRLDRFIIIEDGVVIGNNVWIGSWTHIRSGTKIGHHSEVRAQCFVAGNGVVIGNYTKVCQQANLAAGTKIGNRCFIAPGLSTANTKRMKHQRKVDGYEWCPPTIEDGVRIGANVTILPGVTLKKDSFIGCGAVMTKDAESFGVYVGNPACWTKEIPEEERVKDVY